jgi:hypothetical protein
VRDRWADAIRRSSLSRLEEMRETIRRAEVERRESAYYPPPETRRHLSDAVTSLAAAERALRAVLDTLESP